MAAPSAPVWWLKHLLRDPSLAADGSSNLQNVLTDLDHLEGGGERFTGTASELGGNDDHLWLLREVAKGRRLHGPLPEDRNGELAARSAAIAAGRFTVPSW